MAGEGSQRNVEQVQACKQPRLALLSKPGDRDVDEAPTKGSEGGRVSQEQWLRLQELIGRAFTHEVCEGSTVAVTSDHLFYTRKQQLFKKVA